MSLIASIAIDSIAYGMILFIISVGLSITLGLMRFVNLAHGVFAVAGGYAAVFIASRSGLGYELSAVLAVLIVAAASVPLEAIFIRRLYKRSQLDQVLFTIGLVFAGTAGAGLLFGNSITPIALPAYLQGAVDIGFRVIPRQRLAALVVGLVVLAFLHWHSRRHDLASKSKRQSTCLMRPKRWAYEPRVSTAWPLRWVPGWPHWAASSVRNSCPLIPITR